MRSDLHDAVDILQLILRLRHERDVVEVDNETVLENGGVYADHHVVVIVAHEVVHRGVTADKLRVHNVRELLYRRADGLGLLLVLDVFIDESDDLVLVLKVFYKSVNIDGEQRHAAHDYKAGHYNSYRGEGHESVRAYAAEAFADKIAASIQSHSCNTRPFRH